MNSKALSLVGIVSSLVVGDVAIAQPAPPPAPPTAMPPQPVPSSPPPAAAPVEPPAPGTVPAYPIQAGMPWPTANEPYPTVPYPTVPYPTAPYRTAPYPQAPVMSDVLPAPTDSPVAPVGAPLHMPPGYADQPGLYPPVRSYENGMLVPPGYHVGTEPLRALWASGAGTFVGAYATTLVVGWFASGSNDAGYFFILLAGPIVFGATAQSDERGSLVVGMTFLTLAQTAGVAMFIGGLAAKHQVFVRNDRASVTPSFDVGPGRASFRLTF